MTKAASLVGYMQSLRALCCGEAGWVVVQVVSVHIACVAYSRAATTAKAPKPPSALTTSKRLLEAAPVNGSMEAVELGLELLEDESAFDALRVGAIATVALVASVTEVKAYVTEPKLLDLEGRGSGGRHGDIRSVASGSGHATSADSGCSTASWLGESRDREWVGGVVGVATRHLGLTGAKGLVEHGSVLGGGEDGHESREDEGEELHLGWLVWVNVGVSLVLRQG